MAQVYAKSPTKLRLRKHIQLVDTTTKNKVELELHKLYSSTKLLDNTSKFNLKTPFTIDSVLVANQSKYGIAVLVTGFDRELDNIYGQVAIGVLIGVATLGTFYTYPIVENTSFIIFLFDNEAKELISVLESNPYQINPNNVDEVESKFTEVLQEFLFKKKQ